MTKTQTSKFLWIISPTYKCAEKKKNELINNNGSTTDIANLLKKNNRKCFCRSIVLCVVAQLLVSLGNYFYEGGFYYDSLAKWIFGVAVFFISWIFLFSRTVEIFIAFLGDAIEKLNFEKPRSDLKFGDRLKLSFNSYLELIINFATLCFLVPNWFYKDCYEFYSILEALYFSGVTITTLGYGDISPSNTVLQLLSVFQVIAGFSLIVVSFAVYSNLAARQSNDGNQENS